MTTRSFTKVKKGKEEIWEWEETPEVKDAIEAYWTGVKANKAFWNNCSNDVADEG